MFTNPRNFDRFKVIPKFNLQAEVEKTWTEKVWGGPPQLYALAQVVRRDIVVLQAHFTTKLAGQTVELSLTKSKGLHTIYKAGNQRDDNAHILLFTASVAPGSETQLNHFVPLLPVAGRLVPWPLLRKISNVYDAKVS